MLNKAQKVDLIIKIDFFVFKLGTIRFSTYMSAQDPILHTFFVWRLEYVWPLAPSANFLLCPQLSHNTFLKVVILASWTWKITRRHMSRVRCLSMTFIAFLVKNFFKIELFQNQSCGDAFRAQNISNNVMNGHKIYVYQLSYL